MTKSAYDIIKKQNGEGFARALRDKNLLDIPDIAHIVKYAGHTPADADQIFPYLWSQKEFKEQTSKTTTDPFQLLNQAGYHAFEVHSLDEQNSIKRFFRPDEELCTFRDSERYQDNYIIHAIKHQVWRDASAIQPSQNPQRQDEYGTSVISIQIRKDGGFISIKNRYNHTVDNPDQTYGSNPDNIIVGLSAALKAYFNVDWKSTNHLPSGFIVMNDQILKIRHERNNNYVGDGFYTKNGQIIDVDKNSQIQMDYFIWDNNTRKLLNPLEYDDGFIQAFLDQVQDKKITLSGKHPNQTIMAGDEKIIELNNGQITTLNLPDVTRIDDAFLVLNRALSSISLPHVTEIGGTFLYTNQVLESIHIPSVTRIDNCFLNENTKITKIFAPKLKQVGHAFLQYNQDLTEIETPELEIIGRNFLYHNRKLQKLSLPKAKSIGENFLGQNNVLTELDLPMAESIDTNFLGQNNSLQEISLPSAISIEDCFLDANTILHSISLPRVTNIGDRFLYKNLRMQNISLPSVKKIGRCFMSSNKYIKSPLQVQKQPTPVNQNRVTLAQRLKKAIIKFHNYIRMAYRTDSDYEI